MIRAIISGATGAIGTALIKELISHGIHVLVLCRENSVRNERIPTSSLISKLDCSLENYSALQNTEGVGYDIFYHLAWDGTFGNSRNDMRLQLQNINYSLDALHLAKRFGCSTFIGIGSQAEYGLSNNPLTSTTPTYPENGYGIAKLCAGQMTRLEAEKLGMKHIWVRVLSVYGPNDGERTLITSLILQLRKGIQPECTKGEQIWDYLFSSDAATALRLIGSKGLHGKVYVLGSGEAKPLHSFISQIQSIVNPSVEVLFGRIPYSEKQVMYLCADISELTKDTGFTPQVSFADGIKRIIEQMD